MRFLKEVSFSIQLFEHFYLKYNDVLQKINLCEIFVCSENEKNWISKGLGCYLESGIVVTAYHVLENLDHYKIIVIFPYAFNLRYEAQCIKTDESHDLAYIKLQKSFNFLSSKKIKFKKEIKKNDTIYFFTKGSGDFQKKEGKITWIPRPGNTVKGLLENDFLISVQGVEGDSGGPVFSKCDRLIGIYRAAGSSIARPEEEHGIVMKINESFKKTDHLD